MNINKSGFSIQSKQEFSHSVVMCECFEKELGCIPKKHHKLISPLLWVIKGSYLGFGSPQQQVDMHARSKTTFIVLRYAFIFTSLAQQLLSDALKDSFLQTPPLRDANMLRLV